MTKMLERVFSKSTLINLSMCLVFVGLTYYYLHPGSEAMLAGRVDTMMSDGTDPASIPHAYDLIIHSWKTDPKRLFYGAVYADGGDPNHGAAFWMPWNERWLIIINSWIFPVEQIYTANVFALLLLNGLFMFLLGRYIGWSRTLAFGAAIAWAFTAYTRARAKVHGALAGVYHLPLIFLGLFLVARGRTWKSLALAALAFLGAGTVAHYYLVVSICLSPFFLVFLSLQPNFKRDRRKISIRLAVAVFPLMAFLAFNRFVPVPSDAKMTSEWLMEKENSMNFMAPAFMRAFSAKLVDYISGDISLGYSSTGKPATEDLIPLRESVNDHVISTMTEGNPHERTNGVRWSIILLGLGFIGWSAYRWKSLEKNTKGIVTFFTGFGLLCLWMSLSPDIPFYENGASYWVNYLFPKIRVPSRSGIGVAFALLILSVTFLATLPPSRFKKALLLPGVFPLLMLVDYWPAQAVPMAPVQPEFTHLRRELGHCGQGVFFPFVSAISQQVVQYQLTQRLRGTDCTNLNSSGDINDIQFLSNLFPALPQYLQSLESNPESTKAIEHLARCVPLNWIAFHTATPPSWTQKVCNNLGWTLHEDGTCIAPDKGRPVVNRVASCFQR